MRTFFICLVLLVASASNAAADGDFIPPEAKSIDGNLSSSPTARPVRIAPRFASKLEPLEELRPDQQLRMRLTVVPKHECDGELKVSVITKDGLVCDGPESWTGSVKTDHQYSKDLSVTIPNNDTSTIHIILRCEHWGDRIDRHFVTTGDTVEYWETDPRSLAVQPRKLVPLELTRITRNGDTVRLSSEESVRETKPTPPDTDYFRFKTEPAPRSEYQLREMRRIEETPLIDAQVQYHSVGKDLYRRFEGEKEFTLVPKRSMEEIQAAKKHYLDSIAELPQDAEIRVCLNLRHPKQLEFAKQKLGVLGTPESEAYYHLTVTKRLLEQVKAKGVPIMYLDLEDINHNPLPSERSDP